MIDGSEADDKIVVVLEGDLAHDGIRDIAHLAGGLVDRLRHYFLTYKKIPGEKAAKTEIAGIYCRTEALEIIRLSCADYDQEFSPSSIPK
jgi:inorganic pyrophosphatase